MSYFWSKPPSGIGSTLAGEIAAGKPSTAPSETHDTTLLGYPESVLVRLAIQGELDAAGLKYTVEIKAA